MTSHWAPSRSLAIKTTSGRGAPPARSALERILGNAEVMLQQGEKGPDRGSKPHWNGIDRDPGLWQV